MMSNSAATASANSNSSSGNADSLISLNALGCGEEALAGAVSQASQRRRAFDRRNIPDYLPTATSREVVAERKFRTISACPQRRCRAMTGAFNATPDVVNDYLRLFVNRRAYTLQSMRPRLLPSRSAESNNAARSLGAGASTAGYTLAG